MEVSYNREKLLVSEEATRIETNQKKLSFEEVNHCTAATATVDDRCGVGQLAKVLRRLLLATDRIVSKESSRHHHHQSPSLTLLFEILFFKQNTHTHTPA